MFELAIVALGLIELAYQVTNWELFLRWSVLATAVLFTNHSQKAIVREFDLLCVTVDEDVVHAQISMQNTMRVQFLQPSNHFPRDENYFLFFKDSLLC